MPGNPKLWAALAVLLLAGVLGIRPTGRGTSDRELDSAVARTQALPRVIGDWEGREAGPDLAQYRRMGIAGGCTRQYRNRRTGRVLSLLIVCGDPGPISVHTPEQCMVAAGFQPLSPPERVEIGRPGQPPARFLRGGYRRSDSAVPEGREISWSWGADRRWDAPIDPRLAYAGQPYLYKIYIARHLDDGPGAAIARAESESFLGEVLAEFLWPDRI